MANTTELLEALDPLHLDVFTVLALASGAIDRRTWSARLDAHGVRAPGGYKLHLARLNAMLPELLEYGLVEEATGVDQSRRFSLPGHRAVEVIARSGQLQRLDGLLQNWNSNFSSRGGSQGLDAAVRAFRIVLASGRTQDIRKGLTQLSATATSPGAMGTALHLAIGGQPESRWLELLPRNHLQSYATCLLDSTLWQFETTTPDTLQALAEAALPADKALIAHIHALRGDIEAARALSGLSRGRERAAAIMAAFWAGAYQDVVELGDVALAEAARGMPAPLRDCEGIYYLLACIARSSADADANHRARAWAQSVAPAKTQRSDDFHSLRDFFEWSLHGTRSWRTNLVIERLDHLGSGRKVDWLSVFVRLLTKQWMAGELAQSELKVLDELQLRAQTAGFSALQREAALSRQAGRGEAPERDALATAYTARPRWQLVLETLESVVPGISVVDSSAPRELRWQVMLEADELEIRPRIFEGNSAHRGKIIALAKLTKVAGDLLDDADLRVLATAAVPRAGGRRGRDFGSPSRVVLGEAALWALVGHPRVVDDRGQPLTVVAGEPELRVEVDKDSDGATLRIVPRELALTPLFWQRGADGRLLVYRPDPTMKKIIEGLGDQTLVIPAEGEGTLKAVLSNLASAVRVSGTGPVVDIGEQQVSETQLVARLAWNGRDLELQFVVFPLGRQGPMVVAAEGEPGILAQVEASLRSTTRDLAREQVALETLLENCPCISACRVAGQLFTSGDLEHAYEMLMELRRAQVDLLWNSRQSLRVPRVVELADVHARLKQGRDWLRVGLNVQVDGHKVLDFRELLERRLGQSRFVQLSSDEVLALTDELARKISELASLGHVDENGLRVAPVALALVESRICDAGRVDRGARARRRLKRLRSARELDPRPPQSFTGTLRSYQQDGFVWLARLAHMGLGACLADDMGLGKTIQTLALLCRRARRGPALVIVPASVIHNWIDESRRFAPELRCVDLGDACRTQTLARVGPGDLVVCSYAILAREAEVLVNVEFSSVVFDEAHALKNSRTRRARAAARLQADFRLALTGTPIENHLGELWSLMNIIVPGLLGSEAEFESEFAGPIRNRDELALDGLRLRLRPFVLRRNKTEVLDDLPDLQDVVIRVTPTPDERDFYEALRQRAEQVVQAEAMLQGQARMKILAEITRLRQAAIDPRLIDPEAGPPGAKIVALVDKLQLLQAEGHRALVFTQFIASLDRVGEALEHAGITHLRFDGSTPARARARAIDCFQSGDATVFLISLRAGGQGINLTAADYVFHLDPWWNPAVEDQATSRAHRMGRTAPVTSYRLVTEGTIEEKILALHADKRELAADLLSNLDRAQKLQITDLRALLGA